MKRLRLPPGLVGPCLSPIRLFVCNPAVPFPRQRARQEALMRLISRVPRRTESVLVDLAGVEALRVAAPGVDPGRLVVHLHGGAHCIGTSTMARAFAAHLSRAARAVVYLPHFRRAPEHPFPAGLEDSLALWRAIARDTDRSPALVGDSAGAGLAVATALRLREAGERLPVALGLVCPMLDYAGPRELNRGDRMLSPDWLTTCAAAYAGETDARDPLLSPVYADLTGLPPTLLFSASNDTLAPDAARFAASAREAGVRVEHRAEQGLWHDYPLQAGLIRAGDEAVSSLARLLDDAWGARI